MEIDLILSHADYTRSILQAHGGRVEERADGSHRLIFPPGTQSEVDGRYSASPAFERRLFYLPGATLALYTKVLASGKRQGYLVESRKRREAWETQREECWGCTS